MKQLIFFCWGVCTALPLTMLNAQDAIKFDKNRNGKLEAPEREAYFIYRNTDTEARKAEDEAIRNASLDEISWQQAHPGQDAPTIAELSKMFPDKASKPGSSFDLWGLQIRRSLADVELWPPDKPKTFDSRMTPPATFSYQRDLAGESDAWTAKGVVARPFVFPGVGSSSIIPSTEFDRFSHEGDPAEERDLLIFRLGSEIGLPGIPIGDVIAGNRLRMNAAFKTNSGFNEKTWAGEVEWETSLGPLGGFHPIGDLPFVWFPRAYPRAEFGTRSDHRELLTADEKDFFRVGPVLALKVAPYFRNDWDKRFVASLEYAYLLSAKGDRSVRNFAARFDWILDTNGHLKLGVEYQNGAPTLEEHRTKTVTVGLGVAF